MSNGIHVLIYKGPVITGPRQSDQPKVRSALPKFRPNFDSRSSPPPTLHAAPLQLPKKSRPPTARSVAIMPGTRGPVPVPLETKQNGDLTQQVLDLLDTKEPLQTNEDFPKVAQAVIKAALDRLASRSMIVYQSKDEEKVLLTREAEGIVESGSHELKVWRVVKERGSVGVKELPGTVGAEIASIGQGNGFKNKWIKKDGDSLVPLITEEPKDSSRDTLKQIQDTQTCTDVKLLKDLKKKKLVTTTKVITYTVTKGVKYAKEMPVEHTDLTVELLASGAWETANFKPYNFKALGANQNAGALHPLMKVRQEFRNIFFSQGFVEMPTGQYVYSCFKRRHGAPTNAMNSFVDTGFWNFDALFVPQQHPARDMQDTFFVSHPPKADKPRLDTANEAVMDRMEAGSKRLFATAESEQRQKKSRNFDKYWDDVRKVHQEGAFGSIGCESSIHFSHLPFLAHSGGLGRAALGI